MPFADERIIESMRKKDALALELSPERVAAFWEKVDTGGRCWLHKQPDCRGYAAVYLQPKCLIPAHRFSLLRRQGKLPKDGMYACHKCKNKHCVKPDHIYWGTPQQNAADMKRDGTRKSVTGIAHVHAKITPKIAVKMVKAYAAGKTSVREIAEKYSVCAPTVTQVLIGKTWRTATEGIRVPLRAKADRVIKHGSQHYLAKIDSRSVKAIRRRWEAGESSVIMAKEYGVSPRTIRDLGNRSTWKHIN
ncbi:hypothetical protein Q3G72_025948 [Acer saccharum]|nr:hypothetical protein Q3G72_025948 [Acer saccharum]